MDGWIDRSIGPPPLPPSSSQLFSSWNKQNHAQGCDSEGGIPAKASVEASAEAKDTKAGSVALEQGEENPPKGSH